MALIASDKDVAMVRLEILLGSIISSPRSKYGLPSDRMARIASDYTLTCCSGESESIASRNSAAVGIWPSGSGMAEHVLAYSCSRDYP